MPTVAAHLPGTRLSLDSECLLVTTPASDENAASGAALPPAPVPLAEIDRLVLGSRVHLSSPALAELMRRGVPVAVVTSRGRFLGSFEPPNPPRGLTRLAQFERQSDFDFGLRLAQRLAGAKIANQRRLLQRVDSNHRRLDPAVLRRLNAHRTQAETATTLDAVRGHEGIAAAEFFPAWCRFLPEAFPFEKRSTRPPRNPVNACLSYLGALLYGEMLSACQTRGLDPALGHLHPTDDGRWSLPLDLMEPFRAPVVLALTLRFFSHRILQGQHFEDRAEGGEGGVFLNTEGRRTLLRHYEKTLNREHFSEFAHCRTSLRRQIQEAPLHYKLSLSDPDTFAPFRMN